MTHPLRRWFETAFSGPESWEEEAAAAYIRKFGTPAASVPFRPVIETDDICQTRAVTVPIWSYFKQAPQTAHGQWCGCAQCAGA